MAALARSPTLGSRRSSARPQSARFACGTWECQRGWSAGWTTAWCAQETVGWQEPGQRLPSAQERSHEDVNGAQGTGGHRGPRGHRVPPAAQACSMPFPQRSLAPEARARSDLESGKGSSSHWQLTRRPPFDPAIWQWRSFRASDLAGGVNVGGMGRP